MGGLWPLPTLHQSMQPYGCLQPLLQVDVLQLVDEASNATALVERTWFSSHVQLLVDGTWRGGSKGRKMASLAVFQVRSNPDASDNSAVDGQRDVTRCHDGLCCQALLASMYMDVGGAFFSQHAACCPLAYSMTPCHPLPVWLLQELMLRRGKLLDATFDYVVAQAPQQLQQEVIQQVSYQVEGSAGGPHMQTGAVRHH